VVVASWGLLFVLARRLPPGPMRDLAAFIPDCVTTVRRLRKDPRVPRRAKIAVVIAGLWVASPIDLIPELIPVIGPAGRHRRRGAGLALRRPSGAAGGPARRMAR
jgi:hypothetical protein